MDLYIARQPIFDENLHVFGYELLYRRNLENRFLDTDADEASSNVMINAFTGIGIDRLTGGNPAFVNFTDNLVLQGVATLFPSEVLYVELLETMTLYEPVVEACRKLKRQGYHIALDDFVDSPRYKAFLPIADIIKVDFARTGYRECRELVERLKDGRIRFLAEKVETEEDYQKARSWGYSLFQGYFFSKPMIQPIGEVPPLQLTQLRLLEKLHQQDIEFHDLSAIIQTDVSLSYKLLRLVNSSAFGLSEPIESVHHALVMMGLAEIRKWVSLIVLRAIAQHKPDELVRQSLIRACMLERLARYCSAAGKPDELFLVGLFSNLDVLMGRPMSELLAGVSVSPGVKLALLRREGIPGLLFDMVLGYERCRWDEVTHTADMLGVPHDELFPLYMDAVSWCTDLLGPDGAVSEEADPQEPRRRQQGRTVPE